MILTVCFLNPDLSGLGGLFSHVDVLFWLGVEFIASPPTGDLLMCWMHFSWSEGRLKAPLHLLARVHFCIHGNKINV